MRASSAAVVETAKSLTKSDIYKYIYIYIWSSFLVEAKYITMLSQIPMLEGFVNLSVF